MNKPRRDLITAILLVGVVYCASWSLNLAERFAGWAEHYEYFQIDELAIALFFAALAAVWFSVRRMHDLRLETHRRGVAERAERLLKLKFRTLFDESLCGNFICNRQGEIQLCNEAFATMSGPEGGLHLKMPEALGECWQTITAELEHCGKVTIEQLSATRMDGAPWVVMARFVLANSENQDEPEIHGFFADITELHLAEREMSVLLEENRALTRHVSQAEEEERRRIAREIHDDMGQYLTAIQLDATTLTLQGISSISEHADNIRRNARHIQKTVHALIRRLRPIGLEKHGFSDAIRHLVLQWSRQNRRILPEIEISECDNLSDASAVIAYRVVQESLTNITRHANASQVFMTINPSEDNKHLFIQIRDNGIGFSATSKGSGFGLIGMRERVESVNGAISISSNHGEGVILHATIPLSI